MQFQLILSTLAALGAATATAFPTVIESADVTVSNSTIEKRDVCTFTAFNSIDCTGSGGNVDSIDGSRCIKGSGRHSFSLSDGCTGTTTVYIYTKEGCPNDGRTELTLNGPGCTHVNTGAAWGSALVSR